MIERKDFREAFDTSCDRCGIVFKEGHSNGHIDYCDDCYKFIFDLLEAGEELSMYEIMGEG